MSTSIPKLRKKKKEPEITIIDPEVVEMNLARRSIYQFLTRIFSWEIDGVFLLRFKLPMVKSLLKDLGWKLELDFKKKSDEEIVDELAIEYARLFLGPAKHISPHESVHNIREDGDYGKLWGQSTADVKKFIESAGLKFTEGFTGMPDHIAVELEFIRHIADKECEAIEKGNFDDVLSCLKLAEQFISDHLLKWIESFTKQVVEQAELPFYRSAAAATREVLLFDQKQLLETIDKLYNRA